MAKLASSTVAILLFVAACYYSMPGSALAESDDTGLAGKCNNPITDVSYSRQQTFQENNVENV